MSQSAPEGSSEKGEDMVGKTLTVIDSNLGEVPVGAELEVLDESTNQFTGRHVLNVKSDKQIGKNLHHSQNEFQIFQMPDSTKDVWTEIVVGRDSDTFVVSVK